MTYVAPHIPASRPRPRWRRRLLAAAFVLVLSAGALLMSAPQECRADLLPKGQQLDHPDNATDNYSSPGAPGLGTATCPSSGGPDCGGAACASAGGVSSALSSLGDKIYDSLAAATVMLENMLYDNIMNSLGSQYRQVMWLEQKMIDWWQTMWYYNLMPGMQGMTTQLNSALSQQVLQAGANADATSVIDLELRLNGHAINDQEMRPGEQVCVAGTAGGGLSRAAAFGGAMRRALEAQGLAGGLNTQDDPSAQGRLGSIGQRYTAYQGLFCDTNGNGGKNSCGTNADPEFANADVLPLKFFYNQLTYPVDVANNKLAGGDAAAKGEKMQKAVESIINNMVGLPAVDTFPLKALESAAGQEAFMTRRSYMARYAAVRSVPDLIASWRMPGGGPTGSEVGEWVGFLRKNVDNFANVSANPSYKEIMHALSVDRFSSGAYAADMMTSENKVEMEKLNLSVFYLMQLRDYYQLLERTALTLAVQASVISNGGAPATALPPTPLRKSLE